MGFVLDTMTKDLRRHRRDCGALVLWMLVPLIIGGLITLAAGGSDGPRPTAHVLVADEDGSALSRLLVAALSGQGSTAPFRAEQVDQAAGRARLDDGDGSALVVIPAGFGAAMLREQPTELLLVKNPAQRILPQIVEQSLAVLREATFFVHRVFGNELQQIAFGIDSGMTVFADADVARISVAINQAIQRLQKYLFPPIVELEVVDAGDTPTPRLSYGLRFLPGVVLMMLVFVAQAISQDLWRERTLGTLRRVVASPQPVWGWLLGKVLAGGVVLTILSLTTLACGIAYHGLPWVRLPLAVLWSALGGGVLLLLLMLLQAVATSARAGSILGSMVTLPLLMAGGSFFPFESMPSWLAAIGRWTPNGFALEQIKDLLLARAGSHTWFASVAFGAGAVLLFWIVARRCRGFASR